MDYKYEVKLFDSVSNEEHTIRLNDIQLAQWVARKIEDSELLVFRGINEVIPIKKVVE